eukprot:636514-Alexandrium_andersonii.AAC.1
MPRPRGEKRPAESLKAPELVELAGEACHIVDFGGNGDCGYRAIAAMHAIGKETKDRDFTTGEGGSERALKYGKTLRA